MSFTVYLKSNRECVYLDDHTSNTSRFWHELIKVYNEDENEQETGLQALYGMKGKDAGLILEDAIGDVRGLMRSEDDIKLTRFDSQNGWGSALSALLYMTEIMIACKNHPKKTLFVHT